MRWYREGVRAGWQERVGAPDQPAGVTCHWRSPLEDVEVLARSMEDAETVDR